MDIMQKLLKVRKRQILSRVPATIRLNKRHRKELYAWLKDKTKGLSLPNEPDWAQQIIGSGKILGMIIIEV